MTPVLCLAGIASPAALVVGHRGGGLISAVMRDVVGALPAAPDPKTPVRNATELVRTVRLTGAYQADVVLKLPPYTRLVLDGSLVPTASLNAASGVSVQGQLGTGMVYGEGDMIGVEGGLFNCSGWTSSQKMPRKGTSTLAGILFNNVLGGWVRGSVVSNCGCGSPGGPRPGYVSGNIWVRNGWGNSIQNVESRDSCNRGVWAQTVKLLVWDGLFHDNGADGIDFDSGTSKSVAYNNVCNNNHRHGVFIEEGASANTVVNNTCMYNHGAGVSEGSANAGPTSDNVVLANTLGPTHGYALDVGGGSPDHATRDFVAVGNDCAGAPSGTHGEVERGIFSLNANWGGSTADTRAQGGATFYFYNPDA